LAVAGISAKFLGAMRRRVLKWNTKSLSRHRNSRGERRII
jgi:hypothetical protein